MLTRHASPALPAFRLRRLARALVVLLIALVSNAAAAQPALGAGSQDALRAAGPQAAHILDLWWFTLALCGVVYVAILLACAVAVTRAPRGRPDTPPDLSSLQRRESGSTRSVGAAVGA